MFPLRDLLPLKVILEEDPTPFEVVEKLRPATLPERELATFNDLASDNSSTETFCAEYVIAFFSLLIPRAVTTTSPSCCVSGPRVTLIVD
ncbi:hypothetical protein D3C86_426960 [compost metagenome]